MNKKQRRENEEVSVALTTETSANQNPKAKDNQTSETIMVQTGKIVEPKTSTLFVDVFANNKKATVYTQISQVDRCDSSPKNIKKAKSLLKFTGESTKYRALFLKNGKELQTAWFKTKERAKQAVDILTGKGFQSIIFVD